MNTIPGPITARLLAELGSNDAAWYPPRDAKPAVTSRPYHGWAVTGREMHRWARGDKFGRIALRAVWLGAFIATGGLATLHLELHRRPLVEVGK